MEKLLEEFKKFKVAAVKCFKKIDGVAQSTPAILLTFEMLVFLESVKLAWYALQGKAICLPLCCASTVRVMGTEPTYAIIQRSSNLVTLQSSLTGAVLSIGN